jgi:hypothetical protein
MNLQGILLKFSRVDKPERVSQIVLSQICVCQFYSTDLMARTCQLLLAHYLGSDTLRQPGALTSLSCPSRN